MYIVINGINRISLKHAQLSHIAYID